MEPLSEARCGVSAIGSSARQLSDNAGRAEGRLAAVQSLRSKDAPHDELAAELHAARIRVAELELQEAVESLQDQVEDLMTRVVEVVAVVAASKLLSVSPE